MAFAATRPAVTTSATKIAENTSTHASDGEAVSFLVKNATGTAAVFLGADNTVAAANGFQWDTADGSLSVDLEPGEQLWGIVAATTQTLHVLKQGR